MLGVFVAETPKETDNALYKQENKVWNVGESFKKLCRQLAKPHHHIDVRTKTVGIANHTGSWYVCTICPILATGCGQRMNH